MLLAIDVGNTNITVGVFKGKEIVNTFRLTTKQSRTSDEYAIHLSGMLLQNGIRFQDIKDVIISSVVPNVMHSLGSAIIKYFNLVPIVVEAGIKTGIKVVTENPRQIGADRIVDAAGACGIYGGPVIVIDFGTATTYDLIDKDGAFLAGITAPGIRISAKSVMGRMPQNFRRSKLRSRKAFLQKRRSAVCRQDWYTDRSVRPSISSGKSKKKQTWMSRSK